jgi:hypothetical protein
MTQEEKIKNGNKIIARFMGMKEHEDTLQDGEKVLSYEHNNFYTFERELSYHKSWDWLIPVYRLAIRALRLIGRKVRRKQIKFDNASDQTKFEGRIESIIKDMRANLCVGVIDGFFTSVLEAIVFIELYSNADKFNENASV